MINGGDFNPNLKDTSFLATYGFILVLGIFVGALFVMRAIDKVELDTALKKLRFILYGVGSSMLTTWLIFELCLYFGLPPSLSAAIGGGAGFLGAEVIARLFLFYFQKRLKNGK